MQSFFRVIILHSKSGSLIQLHVPTMADPTTNPNTSASSDTSATVDSFTNMLEKATTSVLNQSTGTRNHTHNSNSNITNYHSVESSTANMKDMTNEASLVSLENEGNTGTASTGAAGGKVTSAVTACTSLGVGHWPTTPANLSTSHGTNGAGSKAVSVPSVSYPGTYVMMATNSNIKKPENATINHNANNVNSNNFNFASPSSTCAINNNSTPMTLTAKVQNPFDADIMSSPPPVAMTSPAPMEMMSPMTPMLIHNNSVYMSSSLVEELQGNDSDNNNNNHSSQTTPEKNAVDVILEEETSQGNEPNISNLSSYSSNNNSTVEEDVKAVMTCPTGDESHTTREPDEEKPEELEDDEAKMLDKMTMTSFTSDDHRNNTSSPSGNSTRNVRGRTRVTYALWCLVMLVLILAAVIVLLVVFQPGFLDTGNNKDAATSTTTTSGGSTNGDDDMILLVESTSSPTWSPTSEYTWNPTTAPSDTPSDVPSDVPSDAPSSIPSLAPTTSPMPSLRPTSSPTLRPTTSPAPSLASDLPTLVPTDMPSMSPSATPTTAAPTVSAAPTMATHGVLTELLLTLTTNVTSGLALGDLNTPQGRAVQWMAQEDAIVLDYFESLSAQEVQVDDSDTDSGASAMSTSLAGGAAVMSVVVTSANGNTTTTHTNATNMAQPLEQDAELQLLKPSLTAESFPQDMAAHLQQRFAVAAMDFALHDGMDTNWSVAELHECEWEGVKCNDQLQVESINWARQELQGYVPPEIALLTNLEELDVADNDLNGFVDVFWTVPSLKILYGHNNRFMGSLGDEVGQMTNLEHLYLGHNKLTGSVPESIFELDDLGACRIADGNPRKSRMFLDTHSPTHLFHPFANSLDSQQRNSSCTTINYQDPCRIAFECGTCTISICLTTIWKGLSRISPCRVLIICFWITITYVHS